MLSRVKTEFQFFIFFLKGQITIFFEAVVLDSFARVRYRPRGSLRPHCAVEYSEFTKKRSFSTTWQRAITTVRLRCAVIFGHEWVFPVTGALSRQGGSFPVTGGHFFPGNEKSFWSQFFFLLWKPNLSLLKMILFLLNHIYNSYFPQCLIF